MKHHIAVLVMTFLLVSVSIFPSLAQDELVAPEPCSTDEVAQVTDSALEWGDQMNAVAEKEHEISLEGDFEKMLDWGELYLTFFNDLYPNLPICIDGVAYANSVGLMLNRQMNLETMIVLNGAQNATETGDADVNEALQAVFDIQHALATMGVSANNALVEYLKSGTGIPNWLPACTDEQMELGTQIMDMEQSYADLQPALQDYLESGTVDKETYIAVLNLVNDMATLANDNPEPCADYYDTLVYDIYTYGDTLTTLTLAQIAPYLSEDMDVDWFYTILDYCNDNLSYLIEVPDDSES